MLLAPARLLALLWPAGLLAAALAFQHLGRLSPCEMCLWQRWPLYGAVALALAALAARGTRWSQPLTVVAGFFIVASGVIAVDHVGVEHHWWAGPGRCTADFHGSGADILAQIMAAPVVQCDVPQWTLAGVSLAGFNALFSLAGGIAVIALATTRRTVR